MVQTVTPTTSQTSAHTIRWIPDAVQNLLHNHDILTRTELANTLGVARSTVYRTFDDDWSGEPSMTMLAKMAGHFRVPLNRIVTEPGSGTGRRKTVRLAG
ncbi:helix-turn-helix domain-containing protein [Mycolicibacterium nivoides]|uniref:helix-turn-helix domain-containing protein n=1 Tax=Mycolicibacterium nivoides TaxID=2487344 RepID=UPI0019D09D42|nr:helix-turn-helix transcriptional regulator [Mycolicibacterium nivoides]